MTTWQEYEHFYDPPDMCDTYALLDDGEIRIVACDQCGRAPCRCHLIDDIPEGYEHVARLSTWRLARRECDD